MILSGLLGETRGGTAQTVLSGMGVQRFQDLRVWQQARDFAGEIGSLLREPGFRDDAQMREELNDAALSIVANIAEGFVRGGRREFAQFIRIAAGSAAEAEALLLVAARRRYATPSRLEDLVTRTESIGKMLRKLHAALRNPPKDPGGL